MRPSAGGVLRLARRALPFCAFVLVGSLAAENHVAHAQYVDTASLSRREVVGSWHSARNNRYTIRPNGTYTFTVGSSVAGNVSHSGTWSLANHGRSLRLHATRRVVLEGRKRRTLKANKRFAFVIATQDPDAGFFLGDEEFWPLGVKF